MGSITDIRARLSPVVFARHVIPLIEPHKANPQLLPWQEKLLSSALKPDHDRVLIACARQSGKSTAVSLWAAWQILHRPESLVLVVSRTERQSTELVKKVKRVYRAVDEPVRAVAEREMSLSLENGSRLIALPGDPEGIRAFSAVDLLLVDEAARVKSELFAAISPMLATSAGKLAMLSTPKGMNNRFAELWHSAEGGWKRYRVTALDLPPDWYKPDRDTYLQREQQNMSPGEFGQEYLVDFTSDKYALFTRQMLEAAIDDSVRELPELEKLSWRHKEPRPWTTRNT